MHRPLFNLACALLLAGSSAAQAQLLPPPKPGDEQPRADITRKAPGGVVSRTGPGTQTEDDIYIGRKVQGNVTPGPASMKPLTPQGPLAAPANPQLVRPAMPGGARGRPSDWCEEDCRKAQGLPDNKPSSPQPKEQPGGEQPRGERRQ